ncbi:MAG TPA: YggS family pyridoxal phosphate-dependent enzyme [Pseudonocardiaceae bacterium]|jgi:pyridoxal phosphate enzyme (YggS family)|nr:YggS family pyridoxal phosphate-dependent enzyme [Pseudonocardiaceae bacterium]
MSRREELAAALVGLRRRICAACAAAKRPDSEVRLLAVTKTFPAVDVDLLVDLGLAEFGESRDQEAAWKAAELAELRPEAQIRWEMVGRLQRNKARSVARWADVVQSVDSPRLADALAHAAGERRAPIRVLVQASLDGDPGRGGCPPGELEALAGRVAAAEGLVLAGVMGIAPLRGNPEPAFESLALMAERLRRDHPGAVELSAGMSGDLEIAIAYGSTCVRVGTALLGGRPLASS